MKLNESFPVSPEKQPPKSFLTKMNRVRVFAALSALALIMGAAPEANAGGKKAPYCRDIRGYHPDNVRINDGERGVVYCVVDADTFDIKLDRNGQTVRVRLWGMDCPESSNNRKCQRQNCDPGKGKKISEIAREALNKQRVKIQGPFRKNGERKIAYVRLENGTDFGENLIKTCMCKEVHGGPYSHKKENQYKKSAKRCR